MKDFNEIKQIVCVSLKERIAATKRSGWIRAGIWGTLYVIFIFWVAWDDWASLGWLVLLPFILDIFTTKYINYGWWRKYKETKPWLYRVLSWVDAIVFALVAVYFINLYIFQNYQIPSSSLEKTLLVGDFLYVDKMAYGPRVPMTPLSMPLVQHTMPAWLGGGQSYINKPHWQYKRLKGWRHPEKGDIVVFNFPAGDTVVVGCENPDYYTLKYQLEHSPKKFIEISTDNGIARITKGNLQHLKVRPVDRRENYVKRCVGTPGDSLWIHNTVVYTKNKTDINWIAEPARGESQLNYIIQTTAKIPTRIFEELEISNDDRKYAYTSPYSSPSFYDALSLNHALHTYRLPLTKHMVDRFSTLSIVDTIFIEPEFFNKIFIDPCESVYPLGHNEWTRDNYGPIYIPRKGDRILITEENFWIYKRIADAYEFKPMRIGEEYEFEMDYFWMMGDNRHKSADSRYWGFVPEDHIVGRPVFIWLSIDKDKPWFKGHIRWSRIGKKVTTCE